MKAALPWLREFAEVPADASAVAARLASCGFAVEGIEGEVIDFEITANRPDCLSVYGLAREAATAYGVPLAAYKADHAPITNHHSPFTINHSPVSLPNSPIALKVSIGDPGCGRYALATAEVTVAPSPAWLADRLTAAGVRPINNVVDATNYVMIECGHPMHAFDAVRLEGQEIRVRRARAGESLVTLDGQTRTLGAEMLVIADRERAVALAGVMGGAASEVTSATTRIAIESAWFVPSSVRATSRKLGLKTEASIRFERGADPGAPVTALARVLWLLGAIGAARSAGPVVDVHPRPAAERQVALTRAHLTRLLGDTVPDADVHRILTALGFSLAGTATGWTVGVPSFRIDVAREADLIEEVGRHWGFDRLPASFPALRTPPRPSSRILETHRLVGRLLCGAGLQEAVTFTFMEAAPASAFVADPAQLVAIANPLSEKFAVLRPSLLPGLLDALVYNRRRESEGVRLFEVGSVFTPERERTDVGWVLTGPRAEHWGARAEPMDVYDAKGIAQLLGEGFGIAIETAAIAGAPWFAPGRAASLVASGSPGSADALGAVGELRADVVAARGLGGTTPVVAGWIDLRALDRAAAPSVRPIVALPRHPSVTRDLSIIVDERLPAADVRGTIRAHAPATLVAVREFDRYQGAGVPAGRVSLSVRLTFRDPERTLTDGEVQRAIEALVAALVREHGAVLRGGT